MKVAVTSDVHGNLEALDAVFRDIEKQGTEKIIFLGDVVGYGCNPNECVRNIDKYCEIKLLGNHDYAALGLESTEHFNEAAQESMDWTQGKLKNATIQRLSDFEMEADFLDYHLVHATPGQPEKWHYILNPAQALRQFDNFSQKVCFVGHSHLPAIFEMDDEGILSHRAEKEMNIKQNCRYIINVGSVGQPRDNDPKACYLLLDTESELIQYRRIEYDIKKTQEKMRRAKMPEFLIDRIAVGV